MENPFNVLEGIRVPFIPLTYPRMKENLDRGGYGFNVDMSIRDGTRAMDIVMNAFK